MKKSKILSFILAVAVILSSAQVFAFAEETADSCAHYENEVVYIFDEDVSAEIREKVIASINGDNIGIQPRGIICNLLGHDIETGTTAAITHKAKANAPRCLQKTYKYETCTRCDEYSTSTLISSTYIYCCA